MRIIIIMIMTIIIIIIPVIIIISDIKSERCFDESMSLLSSSKYMIELIIYVVTIVCKYLGN